MRKSAIVLLMLLLTGCAERTQLAVVSVDTFCTRVERFHGAEPERAALKRAVVAEPLIERFVRWAGGINEQHGERCRAAIAP